MPYNYVSAEEGTDKGRTFSKDNQLLRQRGYKAMKRFLKLAVFVTLLLVPGVVLAAWTYPMSTVRKTDNYIYFSVTFTSDGTDPAAIDILSAANNNLIKGTSLRLMLVDPGTTTVAPDTTIDITITDQNGYELWSDTGISNTEDSWHQMWEDIGDYLPILDKLYIDFNDIGSDGDQVTLYFICIQE